MEHFNTNSFIIQNIEGMIERKYDQLFTLTVDEKHNDFIEKLINQMKYITHNLCEVHGYGDQTFESMSKISKFRNIFNIQFIKLSNTFIRHNNNYTLPIYGKKKVKVNFSLHFYAITKNNDQNMERLPIVLPITPQNIPKKRNFNGFYIGYYWKFEIDTLEYL